MTVADKSLIGVNTGTSGRTELDDTLDDSELWYFESIKVDNSTADASADCVVKIFDGSGNEIWSHRVSPSDGGSIETMGIGEYIPSGSRVLITTSNGDGSSDGLYFQVTMRRVL